MGLICAATLPYPRIDCQADVGIDSQAYSLHVGRPGRESEAASRRADALPDNAVSRVGQLLGDAREDAGLPQSAAGRALGVPQSRIAKLELGRRQLLFLEAVVLADLYGVELERLDPRTHQPRPRTGRRQRMDLPKERAKGA